MSPSFLDSYWASQWEAWNPSCSGREFILLENSLFQKTGSVGLKRTKAALFTQDNEDSQVLTSLAKRR